MLIFSIRNGQPREPALCQLYRRTFVSYLKSSDCIYRRHRCAASPTITTAKVYSSLKFHTEIHLYFLIVPANYLTASKEKQVELITSVRSNLTRERIAATYYHPSRRRMHSSTAGAARQSNRLSSGCALQWAGSYPTKRFPYTSGDLDPYLIHGSLNPHDTAAVPPNGVLTGSAVFHVSPVCPTHRHADHGTCNMCSIKPLLRYACVAS